MAIVAHIFRYRNMGQTLSTLKILRHVLWKSGAGLVEASGWRDGCAVTAGSCGLPLVSYAAQSASSDVSVWAFVGTQACLLLQMMAGLLSPSRRMPSVSHVTSRAAVSSASTWVSSTTCRVGSPWARVRRLPFLSPGECGRAKPGEPGGCPSPPPRSLL